MMNSKSVMLFRRARYIGSDAVPARIDGRYRPLVFENLNPRTRSDVPEFVAFYKGYRAAPLPRRPRGVAARLQGGETAFDERLDDAQGLRQSHIQTAPRRCGRAWGQPGFNKLRTLIMAG